MGSLIKERLEYVQRVFTSLFDRYIPSVTQNDESEKQQEWQAIKNHQSHHKTCILFSIHVAFYIVLAPSQSDQRTPTP